MFENTELICHDSGISIQMYTIVAHSTSQAYLRQLLLGVWQSGRMIDRAWLIVTSSTVSAI